MIIARGAFLHDIGKMAIPDEILRKPGKLTSDEMEVMQEHCYRGYQMVKRIPFLAKPRKSSIRTRNDLTEPAILAGSRAKSIPLGARIFPIADTLDAMTSDRYYTGKAKPLTRSPQGDQ